MAGKVRRGQALSHPTHSGGDTRKAPWMKSESVTPTDATSLEEDTLLEGPSLSPAWVARGEGTRKGRNCLFRLIPK